jgi:hypothetical protein
LAEIADLFATPAVAVVLGLILGGCLAAPLLWASRFATAEKADFAPVVTMIASMGGIIIGAGLLFGYSLLAEKGFVWFGPSVIAGFMIGLVVIGVVMLRRFAKSDDETRS